MVAGQDLFSAGADEAAESARPLADQLRPSKLTEVVGQSHLLGPEGALSRMLKAKQLSSMILWGPPGVGKTTIAQLLAAEAGLEFATLSAVFSGVKDLRAQFDAAEAHRRMGRKTLLFVDEIHRFNRAQQDGFLPFVERGVVTLVGATTENPSFALNGALLSRCQVLVLRRLEPSSLAQLLERAEAHVGRALPLDGQAREALLTMADGDGRFALNLAEQLFAALPDGEPPLDVKGLAQLVQRRAPAYDKDRDAHYDLISTLHKAVRGSDPDAALYWLARMLEGGEDPLYIARRVVRMASEDIGLADHTALVSAIAARDAYQFLGSPEGELALAQAVLHLATAPKSNAAYSAWKDAQALASEHGSLAPPVHAVNAPTKLMKQLGHGAGYEYDHGVDGGFAGLDYFPPDLERITLYHPTNRGGEIAIGERLAQWSRQRAQKKEEKA